MENEAHGQLNNAIGLVRQALYPERLNTIQESVFSQCWLGYTYQDIADELGYDAVYIRGIGSQLWQQLSKLFGEKVTKSNFQAILHRHLMESTVKSQSADTPLCSSTLSQDDQHSQAQTFAENVLLSACVDWYLERPPIESRCYTALIKQGALIRIKASRQMGKTSLMTNVLTHAKSQHFQTVVVSLRLADSEIFTGLDRFLQWLVKDISARYTGL